MLINGDCMKVTNKKKQKHLQEKKQLKNNTQCIAEQIEVAKYLLNRVDGWINNCDNKVSIILGVSGVILTVIMTSEGIKKIINIIYKVIHYIYEYNHLAFLYFVTFMFSMMMILYGLIRFIMVIIARINERKYKQEGLIINSIVFYGTIARRKFKTFQEEYFNLSEKEVLNEILSQVYINSLIAEEKFKNYNIALKYLGIGIFLFCIEIIIGLFII